MRLDRLNDENPLDLQIDGYTTAKGKGNINRKQANDNPDKSEPNDSIPHQSDRSGNQYAVATNDQDELELLGAAEGDRDENKPSNLSGSVMPPL
jgi:hypothetical protein